MGNINPKMITLAREARGISQTELATRIEMSSGNLSKIENQEIGVADTVINDIAKQLNFPVLFFSQQGEVFPEHLIYRKREKVAQSLLTIINAKVNIVRLHIQYLHKELGTENPKLPFIDVTETETPQLIAQRVRKIWKIDAGAIEDSIKLLESKGIAVGSFDFGTERVDSRCVFTEAKYPVIVYNNTLLGDRQRFSVIYQLGHLVMHTAFKITWDRDIAHEANLFAAEFLMPENEIRLDFDKGISLPLLAELKQKWKVSMISLLYRADDLGYLTANQKRYLIQQFNEQKLRRREPLELDVAIEKPSLIRKWIADLKLKFKLDTKGIADFLYLTVDDFIEIYG